MSFYPFALETAGTWHQMAIELTTIHRKHPGDNITFPMPFHGSAKRKYGFFPQHHGNRVNCRCNHNFVSLAYFSCLWLCDGGLKKRENNIGYILCKIHVWNWPVVKDKHIKTKPRIYVPFVFDLGGECKFIK